MIRYTLFLILCALLIFGSVSLQPAHAAFTPMLSTPGNGTLRYNGGGLVGAYFEVVDDNVDVTSLGVWDSPTTSSTGVPGSAGDGLLSDHTVTLWLQGGTQQTGFTYTMKAQATVPAGGGTLVDEFRYVDISAVSLVQGAKYVLLETTFNGSASTVDGFRDNNTGGNPAFNQPELDSAFDMLGYAYTSNNLITPPLVVTATTGAGDASYVGPNLRYGSDDPPPVVPEPTSIVVWSGLIGIGLIGSWRSRRKAV